MRLAKLYHKLSGFYDELEISRGRLCASNELAIAAVLEDDLLSLLEECEEYIIGGQGLRPSQLQSFESRSITVLEEIQTLGFLGHVRQNWH
jgi:hypothetical protein